MKRFEVRDPIHGFVSFNELERDVINSDAFQRLRRIRQLSWTDHVYPGAMHTRFEHTLGVMDVATRLFDSLVSVSIEILRSEYQFEKSGIDKARQTLRLAALVHDLGHGPFSHAAEEVFPKIPGEDEPILHEEYSVAIAQQHISEIIESNQFNKNNYGITIDQVVQLINGKGLDGASLIWKELISGQMDADRMDYLLRDSYHAGVAYGRFDLDRIISSISLCEDSDRTSIQVGFRSDSAHSLEQLIIARYMMFTQVYFHKTRSIYDYHYTEFLKEVLPNSVFPFPSGSDLDEYIRWDDWRVQGLLHSGQGGAHGSAISHRMHHRLVHRTTEVPDEDEINRGNEIFELLESFEPVQRSAGKSWYKFKRDEVLVTDGGPAPIGIPLSTISSVVKGLKAVDERRIYVPLTKAAEARRLVQRHQGKLV